MAASRRSGACLIFTFLLLAVHISSARALITRATVVDGPSADVLGVGNAALAPDGTGGVVWRRLAGGVPHIFASQFTEGRWSAPIRVDVAQPGPASFPAIAAGNGGELLVVWVQPWASESTGGAPPTTHYQLMSAVMAPGGNAFGVAEQVDPGDVGDGTGVYPSLAMAPDGNAYVIYRVVTNALSPDQPQPPGTISPMRAGDEVVDVRAAQFNGLFWSSLGTINRFPGQVTMRKPSASNAPAVAVDREGDALAVWQEPSIDGVARIWARRLFGTTLGNVLAVSPQTIGAKPVGADADAPSMSLNDYGGAEVAFRLAGGAGSPLATPHVLVNMLPSSLSDDASNFAGAASLAGGATVGQPSVAVDDDGAFQAGFTAGGVTKMVSGSSDTVGGTQTLGSAEGDPALATLDPDGGGAAVWPGIDAARRPVLQVRDALPGGGYQSASLTAPISGPIGSLTIGPSGAGDALIAFEQGLSSTAQVAVATVQSPPHRFFAFTPVGWIKPGRALITWDQAPNVIGSVTYSVVVDGRVQVRDLRRRRFRISPQGLGDGVHEVSIIATDGGGQDTFSREGEVKIDANPPLVKLSFLRGLRVRVSVRDHASGPRAKRTVILFGDGSKPVRHRLTAVHSYRSAGRRPITVHCADRAGNHAVDHLWVQVR